MKTSRKFGDLIYRIGIELEENPQVGIVRAVKANKVSVDCDGKADVSFRYLVAPESPIFDWRKLNDFWRGLAPEQKWKEIYDSQSDVVQVIIGEKCLHRNLGTIHTKTHFSLEDSRVASSKDLVGEGYAGEKEIPCSGTVWIKAFPSSDFLKYVLKKGTYGHSSYPYPLFVEFRRKSENRREK